jgi:hypothetical protein
MKKWLLFIALDFTLDRLSIMGDCEIIFFTDHVHTSMNLAAIQNQK